MQLYVLNDASKLALASDAHLKITHADNTVERKFIIGKARLAPLKRITIPNLELEAATN